MEETIYYLSKNPDILEKFKSGTVSLIGVTKEELKAITDVFSTNSLSVINYWK